MVGDFLIQWLAPRDEVDEHHDDGNDQQDVNEPADGGAVTRPSSHKTRRITAIVYNIGFFSGFVLWLGLARKRASQQRGVRLVGRHGHGDGHVVDHAGHAVDIGGELGDEALLGIIFGNAAHGDDAVRR